MAKSLSLAFDVSAELFLNLQQAYDLAKSDLPDETILTRKEFQAHYPAREMIKRGWINDVKEPIRLEKELVKFFNVSSFEEIPHLPHAAKKTCYNTMPPAQVAWLFRAKNLAQKIKVQNYSESKFKNLVRDLSKLLDKPKSIGKIPSLFAKAGIRLVFVEPLKGAKIDGACLWLDASSPVVALSLRFDRIDNFWFCLFHEMGHVKYNDGKSKVIIDVDLENTKDSKGNITDKIEKRANNFATENILPDRDLKGFISISNRFYSKKAIEDFAEQKQRHPGLIVGRLHHLKEIPLSHHRKFLVKVRHRFESDAVIDGWGRIL